MSDGVTNKLPSESLFPVLSGTSSEPTRWVIWGLFSSPRSPQTASFLCGRAQLCAQVCGLLWPGGRHAGEFAALWIKP